VEQADALVTSAREAVANAQSEAKVTGTKDLRGIDDIDSMVGFPAGGAINITLTDKDGNARTTAEFGGVQGLTTAIAIPDNTSIEDLVARLNSIVDADNNHVINAELDAKGQLV